MATRFMESFEHWTTDEGALAKGWLTAPGSTTGSARTGTRSGTCENGHFFDFLGSGSAIDYPDASILQAAWYAPTPWSGWIVQIGNVELTNIHVAIDANGRIILWRGGPSDGDKVQLAQSDPGKFQFGPYNYLKIKTKIGDTTENGAVSIVCNGETVITFTGQTAYVLGIDDDAYLPTSLIGVRTPPWGAIDDILVMDTTGDAPMNDFVGEARISCLFPTLTSGSTMQWEPSTVGAAHATMIRESPDHDSDTTFLSSLTVGHTELWNYATVPFVGTVLSVQLNVAAKKSDSNPRAFGFIASPEVAPNPRPAWYLGAANYTYYRQIWDKAPDNTAWSSVKFNTTEFGVTVVV